MEGVGGAPRATGPGLAALGLTALGLVALVSAGLILTGFVQTALAPAGLGASAVAVAPPGPTTQAGAPAVAPIAQPAAPPAVRIDDAAGRTLAALPVAGDAPLQLRYLHSVYRQPAVEEFAVTAGGLRLIRVTSPSLAVLEYYARPEPVVSGGEGYEIRLAPGEQPPYPRLELRVGAVGGRTLVYAGRELPLHRLAGEGARVTLTVDPHGAPDGFPEGAPAPLPAPVAGGAPRP